MPSTIDSLDSRLKILELTVGSFDFRITSIQLTLNQFDGKFKSVDIDQLKADVNALKQQIIIVMQPDNTIQTFAQYLNGRTMDVPK